MKRFLSVTGVAAVVIILAGVATAQMWGGPGRGMGPGMMGGGTGGGWGGMGPGMMGGGGMYGSGTTTTQITEDKAKELAQEYADKYLAGFTVDKVLPFTGMHHTMYSIELKNQAGEARTIHVNPFGNVMPFGPRWQGRS